MELMIVVAIIGILAAVALPSYGQYIVRANRSAAQAEMMDIANREQQYFLANRAYADLTTLGFTVSPDVSAKYTCTATPGVETVPSLTIACVPISGTPQAADGRLTLTNSGVKYPADKW